MESSTSPIAWDIEAGPLPDEILMPRMPKMVPRANLKNKDAIERDIEDKIQKFFEKAALSPESGMIYAIGMLDAREPRDHRIISTRTERAKTLSDEREDIRRFFDWLGTKLGSDQLMVGHCIEKFDVPFVCARAVYHGIYIPDCLLTRGGYQAMGRQFIDLARVAAFGSYDRKRQPASLDYMAKSMGVGSKEKTGEFYWKDWIHDPAAADAYLRHDLDLTLALALKYQQAGLI